MKKPMWDYALLNQKNELISLRSFLNKGYVVLFFYPKNFTGGCTTEVCSFRDAYPTFEGLNVEVIGISKDSPESHKSFSSAYKLPFELLSDIDGSLHNILGVNKTFGFIPVRVTIIFDSSGKEISRYSNLIQAEEHIKFALSTVKK